MKTKAPGLEVVTRDRATQKTETARSDSTAQPDPTATLQRPGQLRRALALTQQAARLSAFGDWTDARRLRREANRLRKRARGASPEKQDRPAPAVVVVEEALAVGRLERWADRSAA